MKSAIWERAPKDNLGNTHDIQSLSKRYKNLYPGKEFVFDAPFISRDEAEIARLLGPEHLIHIKDTEQKNPQDQRHRYPRNRNTQLWTGNVGFEPVEFLVKIKKLKADIAQLTNLIFPANAVLRGGAGKRRVP